MLTNWERTIIDIGTIKLETLSLKADQNEHIARKVIKKIILIINSHKALYIKSMEHISLGLLFLNAFHSIPDVEKNWSNAITEYDIAWTPNTFISITFVKNGRTINKFIRNLKITDIE